MKWSHLHCQIVCSGHERHRSLVMDAVRCPFVTAQHYLELQQQNKPQDSRYWQMHHLSAPPASACEDTKTLLPVFNGGDLPTIYLTSRFLTDQLSLGEIFCAGIVVVFLILHQPNWILYKSLFSGDFCFFRMKVSVERWSQEPLLVMCDFIRHKV